MRSLIGVLSALLAAAVALSCSLVVDTKTEQCSSDADCAQFPNARCDTAGHVCVSRHAAGTGGSSTAGAGGAAGTGGSSTAGAGGTSQDGGDAGGKCSGQAGCVCAPKTSVEILNACTTSKCVAFDNKTRLTKLGADGGLRPLP